MNPNASHSAIASNQQTNWYLSGCLSPDTPRTRRMIHRSPFTIGRNPGCDCPINSRKVSKLHAEVIVASEVVLIKDLGSTNGTFVNGYRLHDITPVGAGDLVQFADMEFQIERQGSEANDQTYYADSFEGDWLISRMHEVLNLGRFHMVYQPIVNAADQSRLGLEALLRCKIPGLESPLKLLQSAEQLGLECQLSTAARERAIERVAPHSPACRLFLNTHPNEPLDKDLLRSLVELKSRVAPWKLVVEVHEGAVPDLETISWFRTAVHELDIEIAYDDFGAGQSRLREISEVPPDYVKFDRCMIDGLAASEESRQNLIRSLVELCHNRGIRTIAEGIETQEDGDCCRDLGFDHLQGYFYGRPTDLDNLFPASKPVLQDDLTDSIIYRPRNL
ncbi:EAL domain-containing protein [bacterium]|uniref:Diguanylate phosphodiesterase n=1 Tax=Rubinisphaera brasiliensis (strain ATCC 49424 / DSM 5305 / JCM 21570 / IAM 15109 / NBRC 103401 / IFAM 1448) TaxID=756272 RepID=F0SKG0_RUBBR|nr:MULTISPECIES: EAL domain-containing protein [Rubinisphaera]ADY61941.1 diguanylate phosphodiesterase [Rubinisphaera brasiliensis DSM 5305]MBR9803677.1 EAL domain-containing protein [bacterium]